MSLEFTHPPSAYRAESATYSKFWFLWLPLISIPVLFWFSRTFPEFSTRWLVSERTGLIEFINALFPLLTAILGARLLFFRCVREQPFLIFWSIAMIVGGVYLAGEEASWGQHYVGWNTPEFWSGVNDQQETNLHNVSHWFDQKPRFILINGIYITALIEPCLHLWRPHLLWRRFDFIYPALALVPLALCVFISDAASKTWGGLHSFLYSVLRPGEVQELYIVWFLLAYAASLYWRAKILDAEPSS